MNRRKLRRILNACLLGLVGAILIDYFGFPNVSFLVGVASALVAGSAYFYRQHRIASWLARRQKNEMH